MKYNPSIHHRKSIRIKGYDYASEGAYYVTICSHKRECIFGEVVEEEMRLNDTGEIVREEWLRTPVIRREVELDAFIVMPNHLHGIIIIKDHSVGTHRYASKEHQHGPKEHRHTAKGPQTDTVVVRTHGGAEENGPFVRTHGGASLQRKSGTLGSIIAGFKSAATTKINDLRKTPRAPVWQGKFHDHIIRDQADLDRIREYISLNPIKWYYDEENPANRAAGRS